MIERSTLLTALYLAYIVIGTVERTTCTFSKRPFASVQATVSDVWLKIPLYSYLALVGCSILEYFTIVDRISPVVTAVGFAVYLAGVILRRRAMADLGADWSLHTNIRTGHTLVTNGIYRYLKHPYYLAVMLELLGACLVANAFFSATLVVLFQGTILIVRIRLEENLLCKHFSSRYLDYCKGKLI